MPLRFQHSVLLAFIASTLAGSPALAQWALEAGVESFDWREHTTPIEVHEHGPRFSLTGGWMLPRKRGPLLAARAEVYGGSVEYDGSFQFDATKAATGHSAYLGTILAAQVRWRWAGLADAVAGIEHEAWKRQLTSTQEEKYRIVSLRLGAERVATTTSPLVAGGGVRVMLATAEDATVEFSGISYHLDLEPGRGSNPYLFAGVRVHPRVTIVGTWDGMRLGRSNTIALVRPFQPTATVWQPKTDVSRLGIRLRYGW